MFEGPKKTESPIEAEPAQPWVPPSERSPEEKHKGLVEVILRDMNNYTQRDAFPNIGAYMRAHSSFGSPEDRKKFMDLFEGIDSHTSLEETGKIIEKREGAK